MVAAITAVGYIRMSSDEQESSPQQQREAIIKFAAENGYIIIGWYEDLGISGDKTDKRIGFQRMIADGTTGQFDAILCWDQDRFGRFDMLEAGRWIHPLRQAGVHLATVTDGRIDWTAMAGRLVYSVKQEGKHQYLRDLSKNVSRSMDKMKAAGQWTTGTPPYGYVVDADRKLQLDSPDIVSRVREIFERYANGESARVIAEWLSDIGVISSRGKQWTSHGVRELLKNERYLGHMIYGQRCSSKYKTDDNPSGKVRVMPRDQWTVIRNSHSAIVSPELFDKVQDRFDRNRTMTAPTSKNRYALTGLIYCGQCGERMLGQAPHGQRKYVCYSYVAGRNNCQRYEIKEPEALRTVLKVLRTEVFDKFFQPSHIDQIKEAMWRIINKGQESGGEKVDRQHLAKVDHKIELAEERLLEVDRDMISRVQAGIRKLEDQRDELRRRLEKFDCRPSERIGAVESRIQSALGWLNDLESMVETDYDPVKVNRMLEQFVTRVEFNIERTAYGPTGTKNRCEVIGGLIHFRADSLPFDVVDCIELQGSPRRS